MLTRSLTSTLKLTLVLIEGNFMLGVHVAPDFQVVTLGQHALRKVDPSFSGVGLCHSGPASPLIP